MKLFVWHDVLCDYTCGMVVVITKTEAEAVAVAMRQLMDDDRTPWNLEKRGGEEPGIDDWPWKEVHEDLQAKRNFYTCELNDIEKPKVFYVAGGG